MSSPPLVVLAPMEGVVDPIIREMFSLWGGYDLMATEFVRVTHRLNPPKVFYKYSPELHHKGLALGGTPVFVQLLGGDPVALAENAALAAELGAPGIDLNFGCPAKTVNRHDGGAAILNRPHRLYDIITAVKNAVPNKPVTAKIRLGDKDKSQIDEIADCIAEARPHHLIVHARTKVEGYKPPAHWHYLPKIAERCHGIRIYANGEIWTPDDYKTCVQVCGLKDVAIGRGAFARPQLAREIKGQNFDSELLGWDSFRSIVLPRFIRLNEERYGAIHAVRRTKQWVKFVTRQFGQPAEVFFDQIKRSKTLEELKNCFV